MSFELNLEDVEDDLTREQPRTGKDIRGRDVQDQDCRTYVEKRDGVYVYTYEEPDTSLEAPAPAGHVCVKLRQAVVSGCLEIPAQPGRVTQ
jgi:site-specific DNA recombinase